MIEISCVGDKHEGVCSHGAKCCPHNVQGTITTGVNSFAVGGKAIAIVGSQVIHNCPHCGTGQVTTGKSGIKINGYSVSGKGDRVVYPGGSGRITTGGKAFTFNA